MMYGFTRMWQHARKLPVLAAALTLLGVAVFCVGAYGQSAPPVLPDHTVYGRLGTGTGSGPAQAIPFATISSLISSSLIVGTTTVGSGINGQFLYNNSGILGNAALGTMSTQNANAVAITGGTITGLPSPSVSTDAANKAYVDGVAIGLTIHTQVSWATTTVLPNTPNYNNGTAGVGATLTATSNIAIVVDGGSPSSSDRVLVKNQVTAAQNGIYTVTTVGDGSHAWVLTRATDFNTATAGNMAEGAYFFVGEGTTNIASSWVFVTTGAITIGTTALSFAQFSNSSSGSPWGISGSNIYYNAGNVGIGTSSPATTLSVNGNLTTNITGSTQCVVANSSGVLSGIAYCGGVPAYVCNGSNDTAGLNAAIASGTHRLIIVGQCSVTTLTQLPTFFTLQGQNQVGGRIVTTATTGNVLTLSSYDELLDLGITSTVTRTSGDFITIGTVSANVTNISLRNINIDGGFFNAIHIGGVELARFTDIYVVATTGSPNDCVLIDGVSGVPQPNNTDIQFSGLFCQNTTNGIEVTTAGDVRIVGCQIEGVSNAGIFLNLNGTVATGHFVQWFDANSCLVDSFANYGFNVNVINGAEAGTVKIENSWIVGSLGGSNIGVVAVTDSGNGSLIGELGVVNDLIADNHTYGIALGDATAINNLLIADDSIAGNGAGIHLGTSAANFRIENNKIGKSGQWPVNTTSISCAGGSYSPAQSMIIGNDMTGQSSGCSQPWVFSVNSLNINF